MQSRLRCLLRMLSRKTGLKAGRLCTAEGPVPDQLVHQGTGSSSIFVVAERCGQAN